jgi:hypothetical protein
MRARIPNRAVALVPLIATAIALSGCWTAPIASVQPKGETRLIQGSVAVESVKQPAIVRSVDAGTRTIVVQNPASLTSTAYRAGPKISNFDRIRPGDRVRATVAEELTILVSKNGRLPDEVANARSIDADARVLTVDPSYRLLTLKYPDGHTETFKVGLHVRLSQMEPGDDVLVRAVEAVALQVQAP